MNTTLFFSDLDRTIIFSKVFQQHYDKELLEVEEGISYMTPSALATLETLRTISEFVPVTARTYKQIMRIDFIRNNVPKYMICENGAAIYVNGQRDAVWDALIKTRLKYNMSNVVKAQGLFKELVASYGQEVKEINSYMHMSKFTEMSEELKAYLKTLHKTYSDLGCTYSVQDPRKVYITPKGLDKGKAVQYIRSLEGSGNWSISAGDSEMDVPMFKYTSTYICPKSHSITSIANPVTTKMLGIDGGEELLLYTLTEVIDSADR